MVVELSLEFVKSEKTIQNEMFKVILAGLNKEFAALVPSIKKDIAKEIPDVFIHRDVTGIYKGLTQGPLNFEFGFPKGTEVSIVSDIINQIAESILVEFIPMKKRGQATTKNSGFIVKILRADFEDILGLPAATTLNISSKPDVAKELPWLEWLLLRGDAIIISDHRISFEPAPHSRSGGAIMIDDRLGVWKVPEFAAGTIRSNWLTKTVIAAGDFLQGLSKGVVDKHLKTVLN